MRALALVTCLLIAREARAHFALQSPLGRSMDLGTGPCGKAGSTRGARVTAFRPGQTIVVRWNVFVEHTKPGRYRIALDDDGQDFALPGAAGAPVLPLVMDGIVAAGTGVQQQTITLPNVECSNCTLQMLQYLTGKPPYNAGSFYYQCADLVLSASAPAVDGGVLVVDAAPLPPQRDAGTTMAPAPPRDAAPRPPDATPVPDAAPAPSAAPAAAPPPRAMPAAEDPPAADGDSRAAAGCHVAGASGRGAPGLAWPLVLALLLARRRRFRRMARRSYDLFCTWRPGRGLSDRRDGDEPVSEVRRGRVRTVPEVAG
jgi:MYXO-CTERM domain-containing protein